MLFPTPQFAIFFFAIFLAAWALRAHAEPRKALLLGASYVFYGWWDWRFMGLLAGSSAINYLAGLGLASSKDKVLRKRIVITAVALDLCILGIFKYYNFFMNSLTDVTLALGLHRDMPFLEIILPVGISFFTFQGISYVIDVDRGHIKPVRSPLDLFLYISFFPQLVAGPIVRASHFLPQLNKTPKLNRTAVTFGFLLILNGMFKKVVVAHYIAAGLVDPVFAEPARATSTDLIAAHYAYAVQVYCDFSAYSDIAIGTAALLGFRFRKNFDRPLGATSLAQLWNRWHISLSTWLRDYLYRALRGDKRDHGARMYRNIFLTMLLGGLWHGANWTFVIWGAIHGVGLCTERFIKTRWHAFKQSRQPKLSTLGAAAVGDVPSSPGSSRFATFMGWLDHLPPVHAGRGVLPQPHLRRRLQLLRQDVRLPGRTTLSDAVPAGAHGRCRGGAVPARQRHRKAGRQDQDLVAGLARPAVWRRPAADRDDRPAGRGPVHLFPLLGARSRKVGTCFRTRSRANNREYA